MTARRNRGVPRAWSGFLCVPVALFFALPQAAAQPRGDALVRSLDEVARVASIMLDGDVCRRIVSKAVTDQLFTRHPRDPWIGSDNYNVNQAAFIQIKKTLLRLGRLAPLTYDVNLWMPIEGRPGKVHLVIRNANEISQFWTWGSMHQDAHPSMSQVLASGTRVTVSEKPGMVSILTPVFDSMGDVVAIAEVAARRQAAPRENVK